MWPFSAIHRQREDREQKIIGLLDRTGELSSYQIGNLADLGAGVLYPALQRLERDGRLSSRWGVATAERGWHRPRLYSLRS